MRNAACKNRTIDVNAILPVYPQSERVSPGGCRVAGSHTIISRQQQQQQ